MQPQLTSAPRIGRVQVNCGHVFIVSPIIARARGSGPTAIPLTWSTPNCWIGWDFGTCARWSSSSCGPGRSRGRCRRASRPGGPARGRGRDRRRPDRTAMAAPLRRLCPAHPGAGTDPEPDRATDPVGHRGARPGGCPLALRVPGLRHRVPARPLPKAVADSRSRLIRDRLLITPGQLGISRYMINHATGAASSNESSRSITPP